MSVKTIINPEQMFRDRESPSECNHVTPELLTSLKFSLLYIGHLPTAGSVWHNKMAVWLIVLFSVGLPLSSACIGSSKPKVTPFVCEESPDADLRELAR